MCRMSETDGNEYNFWYNSNRTAAKHIDNALHSLWILEYSIYCVVAICFYYFHLAKELTVRGGK